MVRRTILVAAFLLTSCVEPAKVELVNASGTALADAVVIAKGATVVAGNLNPHQRRTLSICPSGESSLEVRFIARGAERSAQARTYVECSSAYDVQLEVAPDFSVRSTYRSRPAKGR